MARTPSPLDVSDADFVAAVVDQLNDKSTTFKASTSATFKLADGTGAFVEGGRCGELRAHRVWVGPIGLHDPRAKHWDSSGAWMPSTQEQHDEAMKRSSVLYLARTADVTPR